MTCLPVATPAPACAPHAEQARSRARHKPRRAIPAEADFPDRAIAIYRKQAEAEVEQRSRSNYQVAAKHLARAKATLERHGRRDEWKALIGEIRESNKRLRALREELDNLGLI